MRNNDIFTIEILLMMLVVLFLLISFIILKSCLNIIIIANVNNDDININLNIKYLFNLINIKIPLYPVSKKLKTKKSKSKSENIKKVKKAKGIKIEDVRIILNLLKKVKINEVYCDIKFGNEHIGFTSFIYVFINTIYGNLINIINPQKMYLNVSPDFTKNFIKTNIKIHIKPTIKDIISIAIGIIKIYFKIRKNKKDGENCEVNRVNTKSHGDNI